MSHCTQTNLDIAYLFEALALAKLRKGFCAPNPAVGAVIILDGKILSTGYHLAPGHPHAEIDALAKLNYQAEGATIYVTLEPCCHFGRTPPCSDALIKAGIKRVVYGFQDPNPIVSGKGKSALIDANIICEHIPLPDIDLFYQSYSHWQRLQRPFITAKIAISLDGKMAGPEGEPICITGKELSAVTHHYRKSTDGILTTAKTVIHDNPQLNTRLNDEIIAKPLYILDRSLKTPLSSTIFTTAKTITFFHSKKASAARQQELIAKGVRCVSIDETSEGLDLIQVIQYIGKEGLHDLWLEAGSSCFSAFVEQNLLQRALIYVAPNVLGKHCIGLSQAMDFRNCQINWQQYGNEVLCDVCW